MPKGHLPVFSVADMEEANDLIVATCSMGPRGKYYAAELAQHQTIANLERFSTKLDRVHDILKERGRCRCAAADVPAKKPKPPPPPCSRCDGTGDDPEISGCKCDCCGGTGIEFT